MRSHAAGCEQHMTDKRKIARDLARQRRTVANNEARQTAQAARERVANVVKTVQTVLSDSSFTDILRSQRN
jgi:hypothetical protein